MPLNVFSVYSLALIHFAEAAAVLQADKLPPALNAAVRWGLVLMRQVSSVIKPRVPAEPASSRVRS